MVDQLCEREKTGMVGENYVCADHSRQPGFADKILVFLTSPRIFFEDQFS
jgi:hypothetical protein